VSWQLYREHLIHSEEVLVSPFRQPNRQPFRRRLLGRKLAKLREHAGITQQEVADHLEYSLSKISRFEHGQLPDIHALKQMLDFFGLTVSEWEPYLEMWRRAKAKRWYHMYGLDDQNYISMEDEASELWEWQCLFIPGLFQTARYARDAYSKSKIRLSKKTINTQIEVRMRRQDRLTGEDPIVVHALIDHALLLADVPADIMREQVQRIIEVSKLDNVTVRIMPANSENHDGKLGPFTVLGFPDKDEPDIGYAEHAYGSTELDNPEKVKAVRLRFDHLASLALSPEDSLTLLDRLAATL
jgi:transcriptional regulator with XRE-family HTH domain